METSPERRLHVVLMPCPAQGHMGPMLQLGAVLHSHGFSITVASIHPNFPDPSDHPNFQFFTLSSTGQGSAARGEWSVIGDLNTNFRISFKDSLKHFVEQVDGKGEAVSCVIYDGVLYFAEGVSSELGIPSIVLRTICAANVRWYREYPRLQEEGHFPLQDSKSLDLLPGLEPLRFKDLSIYNDSDYEELLRAIDKMRKVGSSLAVIINTTETLDREPLMDLQRTNQIPILALGPLYKISPALPSSILKEDATCITWLDTQEKSSVLYVSIGSFATIDEIELVEMAWGLANSQKPFLWVIRPGSVRGSKLSEKLPEGFIENVGPRGLIVEWAPQKEVLRHESIGGFWSHCGWNSTLESICEGVPMLCTPFKGDQRMNARYACHVWKVGVMVEDIERGAIARAVEKLLGSEDGEMLRLKAAEFKESVEHSIGKGGSSFSSLQKLLDLIRVQSTCLINRK